MPRIVVFEREVEHRAHTERDWRIDCLPKAIVVMAVDGPTSGFVKLSGVRHFFSEGEGASSQVNVQLACWRTLSRDAIYAYGSKRGYDCSMMPLIKRNH